MTKESVVKHFAYLDWRHMLGAVLDVFHENQHNDEQERSEYKASADTWCFSDDLRRDIHQRARRYWCNRTGMDVTYFPMSVDFVSRLYFRIRKRRADEVPVFDQVVAEASGEDFNVVTASLFDTLED